MLFGGAAGAGGCFAARLSGRGRSFGPNSPYYVLAAYAIACICILNSNHSVDVFLDILDESFDDVQLTWTIDNESLNCMVDLLLVLADIAHL